MDGQNIPGGNPRMLDFAVVGNALEVVMGWEVGTFDRVYSSNREQADEIALENSPIVSLLYNSFADKTNEWIGTATELKDKLLAIGGQKYALDKLEAMSASSVGISLSEITKNLNSRGWKIEKLPRSGKDGRRNSIKSPSYIERG